MIRLVLVAAFAGVLFFASTASAAETKGTATSAELARVLLPKAAWTRGVEQTSQEVQQRFLGHPGSKLKPPPDFAAKVRAEVEAVATYEEYIGWYSKALASGFTDAEMKDLVAFYRTPAGQKWVKVMPAVSEKYHAEVRGRLGSKMPEVMKRLATLIQGEAPAPSAHESAAPPRDAGATAPSPAPRRPAAAAGGSSTSK